MLENILATGGTNTHDLINKTMDLQPHNNDDYMRFQTELGRVEDSKIDNSILEVKSSDAIQVNSIENNSKGFDTFKSLDSGYHRVLSGMQDFPTLAEHLKAQGISGGDSIRTNTDGMASNESFEDQTRRLLDDQQKTQNATMEYHTDLSRWQITTEMFLTKVKILTSVVSQASQGLKTLFRSSG